MNEFDKYVFVVWDTFLSNLFPKFAHEPEFIPSDNAELGETYHIGVVKYINDKIYDSCFMDAILLDPICYIQYMQSIGYVGFIMRRANFLTENKTTAQDAESFKKTLLDTSLIKEPIVCKMKKWYTSLKQVLSRSRSPKQTVIPEK